MRQLKLRWATTCSACTTPLAAGTTAWWDSEQKSAMCGACHNGEGAGGGTETATETPTESALDFGVAGASARREHERKATRERKQKEAAVARDAQWRTEIKAARPVVGRIAAALTTKPVITPESQSTRAWEVGAVGEEQLGRVLDGLEGVHAIHDRRVPGTKANIDHVVVGPGGTFVVDAKRYKGRVEHRDVGSFFRPDFRLHVAGRDCSKLVPAVHRQAKVVHDVIADDEVAVYAGLCFIDSEWSLFSRPFFIDGVWIGWPKALVKWVTEDGPLTAEAAAAVAERVANTLRPA